MADVEAAMRAVAAEWPQAMFKDQDELAEWQTEAGAHPLEVWCQALKAARRARLDDGGLARARMRPDLWEVQAQLAALAGGRYRNRKPAPMGSSSLSETGRRHLSAAWDCLRGVGAKMPAGRR